MAEGSSNSSIAWWDTARGGGIAIAVTIVMSVVLLFGNLSGIGIWEPWEAHEILVAKEYATRGVPPESADPKAKSWNDAVPTSKKRPVNRPLLKTMLISKATAGDNGGVEVGALERRARLPVALMLFAFLLAAMAWVRNYWGTGRAAVVGLTFASMPGIYLGAHNLASEMMLVVATSGALIAFAEATVNTKRRWIFGAVFGGLLALSVLDQRLLGLYLPLLLISAWCAVEAVYESAADPGGVKTVGPLEIAGALVAVLAGAAIIGWGAATGEPDGKKVFAPWALQIVAMTVPAAFVFAGLWLGRQSAPGKAFWGGPGLLGAAIGVVTTIVLARIYSAANPILLDGGELFGSVGVFSYLLDNHIFERSVAEGHTTFDVGVRQVGFALFPWAALFPVGFAYASRSTQLREGDARLSAPEILAPSARLLRFFLVWMFGAALIVGAAGAFDHYFYPAFFPIAAAIGLALTDERFWERARTQPLMLYAMGFVGIAIVLMLGKDLERFPARFIETYLTLQTDFELPDDFKWGKLYKPLKYAWAAGLAVYFFGLVSFTVITWRGIRAFPAKWKAFRQEGTPLFAAGDTAPFIERAAQKQAVRDEDGVLAKLARLVETPTGFAPAVVLVFAVSAALFLFSFIPNVTNHLSQRGLFESYTAHAKPGETLVRYQVSSRDNSVYLDDVPALKGARELQELFDKDERFFAVIPRAKLAAINFEIREKSGKNVPVLDARSSRLLLISNKLEAGEEDQSFVAKHIIEGEPEIQYPLTFKGKDGKEEHAVFDGQLEFLGYSYDRPKGEDGMVEYAWGETAQITYFFRVLKKVPSSQKMFIHVDYPGTRLNGDHYPNDGDFPTNYWPEGAIVTDVFPLKIDSYSAAGVYTHNMGFFLGSRRMRVTPREAHDGHNRVTLGRLKVGSGL